MDVQPCGKGFCCGDRVVPGPCTSALKESQRRPLLCPPFLVSSSGLKATPSSLGKMLRSDILVFPDAIPAAAGRCLTHAGFGSWLGCSVNSPSIEAKPQSEEECVILPRLWVLSESNFQK